MTLPAQPKIYHIVHVGRLPSIIANNGLLCDAEMVKHDGLGTAIGMEKIKKRRLSKAFSSHPDLHVGECVPFYFCPRSVMLYMFHKSNHAEIEYQGGQEPIIHLVADLQCVVKWAENNKLRWVFTDSNAGSHYFNDYTDLSQLGKIDWNVVNKRYWEGCQEKKQAEFLVETRFPWGLVERVGVYNPTTYDKATQAISVDAHKPKIEIKSEWYY